MKKSTNTKPVLMSEDEITKQQVKLPTFGKLTPVTYIIPAYISLFVVLLALVLVVPGLVSPGLTVTIQSSFVGGNVLVDGTRIGSSPLKVRLAPGTHEIEVQAQYFIGESKTVTIGNHFFASIFGFSGLNLTFALQLPDPKAFLDDRILEFSSWSLSPNGSLDYHVPEILTPAVTALLTHVPEFPASIVEDFMIASAGHIGNLAQASDWLTAWALVFGKDQNDRALKILGDWGIGSDQVLQSHFSKVLGGDIGDPSRVDTPSALGFTYGGQRSINNVDFSIFSSPIGDPWFVSNQEVTVELFNRFLLDRPEWSETGKALLLEQGLVDSGYLSVISGDGTVSGASAMSTISYHSVIAFLEWFSTKLGAEYEGYAVTVPSFQEWDTIDKAVASIAGDGPWLEANQTLTNRYPQGPGILVHWRGGLFEFTRSTGSLRQTPLLENQEKLESFPGLTRIITGGGFTVSKDEYEASNPRSWALPHNWTSEVTGFRIWIIPKIRNS